MRMGQGIRTGLGHGGIICVLQTQFSIFFLFLTPVKLYSLHKLRVIGRGLLKKESDKV